MDLIIPESGLIIWQIIITILVLYILGKFAWKPILNGLKTREDSIEEALLAAEKAKEEMASLKADNEKLLIEAREERDKIIQAATKAANDIKEKAKEDASRIGDKMIDDARASINAEKNAALKQIKDQVAELSLQISEKLLKKSLESDKAQKELLEKYIDELKMN